MKINQEVQYKKNRSFTVKYMKFFIWNQSVVLSPFTAISLPWELESSEKVIWDDEKSVGPCESPPVEKP